MRNEQKVGDTETMQHTPGESQASRQGAERAAGGTETVDVLIVGAGVVGTAAALALSMFDVSVAVVERRSDVGEETSKANSGIAATGSLLKPGSLEARLVCESNPQWEDITCRLGVTFRRVGLTLLALSEAEANQLPELMDKCLMKGIDAYIVAADDIQGVAPHASRAAVKALHVPQEGVIDSGVLPVAYAEVACENGVRFFLSEPMTGATVRSGRIEEVSTVYRTFRPRFVVNAGGLGADFVSRTFGAEGFSITPRRGQWLLLDREFGHRVPGILTGLPNPASHGPMVIPTAHGSVLLGPDAQDIEDKQDNSTTMEVMTRVLADCRALMPEIDSQFVTKMFAGVRSHAEPTYQIGLSELSRNLIQVAGIRSTGVSASPAIGAHVTGLLGDAGLELRPDPNAVDRRTQPKPLWSDLDFERSSADPLGRTVVCACEKVTAADIHVALSGRVPARSIAGVAKRTHATWGRCQGSACLSGVSFITSLHTGGKPWTIDLNEPGSTLGVAEAFRG